MSHFPSNFPPEYHDDSDYNTNAKSYYDYLSKSNKALKILSERIWKYDETLAALKADIEQTMTLYSNILDGKISNFDDIITGKTDKWLDENMEDILTQATKLAWFGLTDDGYFMAVVPANWDDVSFDTNNEGQLMLIN